MRSDGDKRFNDRMVELDRDMENTSGKIEANEKNIRMLKEICLEEFHNIKNEIQSLSLRYAQDDRES